MRPNPANVKSPAARNGFHQNLLAGENIYHKMIEEIEDYAIIFLDINGIVISWNKGACKIKGYKTEEIIGKSFRLFYTREDQLNKIPEKILKEAVEKGKVIYEGWRVRKDGSIFWASIVITSIHEKDNRIIGFTKVTRDLTGRKEMEDNMLNAIVDTQEKERKEISDELHDNVNQRLATSKLFMEMAGGECRSNYLLQAEQNLLQALVEIRNISHRLSPNVIINLGLPEAIEELVESINQLKKIKAKFFYTKHLLPVDADIQLALYRIVQEQTSNILKHSGATTVKIELLQQKKQLTLLVSDNGCGFEFNKVKKGLGLQNILYRAERCRGKASFLTSPGKGCVLRIDIPIGEKPAAATA